MPLLAPAFGEATVKEKAGTAQNSGTTGDGNSDGPNPISSGHSRRKECQAKTDEGSERPRQHETGALIAPWHRELRNLRSQAQPVRFGHNHRSLPDR